MALRNLDRLVNVQEDVINKTDSHIQQLEKYKSDYAALKERLLTLADRVSYDIMVPFGTVAFMPGRLVHTNEIRVYLGDNWFVDRSTKQAIEIIDRRIESIKEDLGGFQKQKELLKPYLNFTTDVKSEIGETFEILESCSEEELTAWKAEHRQKVKRLSEEQLEAKKAAMTDEEEKSYWKDKEEEEDFDVIQLNHEVEEEVMELRPESLPLTETGSAASQTQSISTKILNRKRNSGKTVRWQDIVEKEEEQEVDEDSSDDSEEYVQLCRPSIIHFVHTASEGVQPVERSTTSDSSVQPILSPADIGLISVPVAPKSILKKRPSTEDVETKRPANVTDHSQNAPSQSSKVIVQRSAVGQSVTSVPPPIRPIQSSILNHEVIKVVEKNVPSTDPFPSETNPVCSCKGAAPASETNKPISKFKASRLQNKSSMVK